MIDILFSKLKLLLKNPMILFIYGIIAKWYIMIMVAALVVTFWVFSGLKDTGFLDAAEKTVTEALDSVKAVSQHCVPKILSFGDFWECLENPPSYRPTKEEKALEEGLTDLLDISSYDQKKDPYAEKKYK